jgi:hypothetical protein
MSQAAAAVKGQELRNRLAQMQMGSYEQKQQAAADALAKQAGLQQRQSEIFGMAPEERPEALTGIIGEYWALTLKLAQPARRQKKNFARSLWGFPLSRISPKSQTLWVGYSNPCQTLAQQEIWH